MTRDADRGSDRDKETPLQEGRKWGSACRWSAGPRLPESGSELRVSSVDAGLLESSDAGSRPKRPRRGACFLRPCGHSQEQARLGSSGRTLPAPTWGSGG